LFLTNFSAATSLVAELMVKNSRFSAFVKDLDRKPEARGLSFNAFLLTPVQRIPRYKLLLEDLIKRTSQDHPDHPNLKTALALIDESRPWLQRFDSLTASP